MPLYTPALFSGQRLTPSRGQYPSLGDASPFGQPVTQFSYQDASTSQGFSPGADSGGPTRDWQAISDSEQQWRDEPNDVSPGSSNLLIASPDDAPTTVTKEYTHMDLAPWVNTQVPSVAVRNANFNPSEAGVDNRRGVWRMGNPADVNGSRPPFQPYGGQMPIGLQPSLGALNANTLEISGVIAGVLILVAGIAMWKNRRSSPA